MSPTVSALGGTGYISAASKKLTLAISFIHDPKGHGLVSLVAKGHGPKTDLGDHQTTPTKTTLPHTLPLLCLERLIDGRSQLGVVRACSRAVVANHVARFVDQELFKVHRTSLRALGEW